LERKIAKKELESRSLKNDQTYQCLWAYCVDHHDYERKKYLLQLRLTQQDIDLDFYKEAEQELNPDDWRQFEPQILTTLQNQIQQQPKTSFGFGFFPYTSMSPLDTLAAIYHYKKEPENLFVTVKNHTELLRKYEALLLPRYPHEYLAHYRSVVDRYIAGRGRENYQAALPHTQTIKRIYTDIVHKPAEWTTYITDLRTKHKTLRALQEELAGL
jgi:hypothetical protein